MKCFTPACDRRIDDVARSLHIDFLKEARIVNDEDGCEVIHRLHIIKAARQRFRLGDVADSDVDIVSIQSGTKAIAIIQDTHLKAAICKSLYKGRAHDAKATGNQNHNTKYLKGGDDANCRQSGNP